MSKFRQFIPVRDTVFVWEEKSGMSKFILGLGNPSMADDSVGLRLVEEFFENAPNGFESMDMAHDSMRLLFHCEPTTERIIVVDCVEMGLEPGEFRVFVPEDVESQKDLGYISTHEGDVLKVIELGRQLGYHIPPIQIFGIQPQNVGFGLELSHALQVKYDVYVRELKAMMAV
jgi:hydrogenase maturation protease